MKRRSFLATNAAALSLGAWAQAEGKKEVKRVCVIGHTGRGNYGHGIDTVWLEVPETEIVAVADPHPAGLQKAMKRLKVTQGFSDYNKMLAQVRPEIVAVCPRQPDQHFAMCSAAIKAGAKGIYVEKPFCRTPIEADQLIKLAEKNQTQLAVAHRNRYHPTLQAIDQMIEKGMLGKVLEIRGRGKGDHRGGSEDLWVLGGHVFNLATYFAGKPVSCSALILQNGKPVTSKDVKEGNEAIGLIAGNEIHARYQTSKGIPIFFDSVAKDGTRNAGFGLQIIGSKGVVDIKCDLNPLAHWIPGNPFLSPKEPGPWIPISSAGPGKPEPIPHIAEEVAHHVVAVKDLLKSIDEKRPPLCDIHEAALTVEMICAVFASHVQEGANISFPLTERDNALKRL